MRAQSAGRIAIVLLLLVHRASAEVSEFFVHVKCHGCSYHLSVIRGNSSIDMWEEINEGETKTGIAYRGEPLHYSFTCDNTCAKARQSLMISLWPRDATSLNELTLLVQKDEAPSMRTGGHLQATTGWFSGQVVTVPANEEATYYITVVKNVSQMPMPFQLLVRLPATIQHVELGRPYFGAVSRDTMSYFKFEAKSPDTDIEVYVTRLSGNPDIHISHASVDEFPSPTSAQWHVDSVGDDEIVIKPDDPARNSTPTGWFHVGIGSEQDSAFSIIILVEPHVELNNSNGQYVVIQWNELFLGTPQEYAVKPYRQANFIFYNHLAAPKLSLQAETSRGDRPDVCVQQCGPDPHGCPFISPQYAGWLQLGRAKKAEEWWISDCGDSKLLGDNGDMEATLQSPCVSCWYSILVTTLKSDSKFRLSLGADGSAQPLVPGQSFRGHVDFNDSSVVLVLSISKESAHELVVSKSMLRATMTTIYGDPLYSVHRETQDGEILFDSETMGQDGFEIPLVEEALTAGSYYFVVRAGSEHSQFRFEVFFERGLPGKNESADKSWESALNLLVDGEATEGVLRKGSPDIYIYTPAAELVMDSPSFQISVSPLGPDPVSVYVNEFRAGHEADLYPFISDWKANAHWKMENGSQAMMISASDEHYLSPGDEVAYVVIVDSPRAAVSQEVHYMIFTSSSGHLQELPATGVPVPGSVKDGEYRRYRLNVAEARKDIYIALQLTSGDADLYVGTDKDVNDVNNILRSKRIGSDVLFIPGDPPLNPLCSKEAIEKDPTVCVYWVAVRGKGAATEAKTEFAISARVQSIQGSISLPIPLGIGTPVLFAVQPEMGAAKDRLERTVFFYAVLELPIPKMRLQVDLTSGDLRTFNVKVLPEARARRPTKRIVKDIRAKGDFEGTRFAGVFSIDLEPEELEKRCLEAQDKSGCALLVAVEAPQKGILGSMTLEILGRPAADPQKATKLQVGMPQRLILESSEEWQIFSISVPKNSDIHVSMTPLSQCNIDLQAHLDQGRNIIPVKIDPVLMYATQRISAPAGIAEIWARSRQSSKCEADLVVELVNKGEQSVDNPIVLRMNTPIVESVTRSSYLLFSSRIGSKSEASSRDDLKVRITTLSGQLQVFAAIVRDGAEGSLDELATAHEALQPIDPDDSLAASNTFTCDGFSKACGDALMCQILIKVVSPAGHMADFHAEASADRTSAALIVPAIPVSGCLSGDTDQHDDHPSSPQLRYQLFLNNPAADVVLRLSCQEGSCASVRLSSDTRRTIAELEFNERRYRSAEVAADSTENLIELPVPFAVQDALKPGTCTAPCVLYILVELVPGGASRGPLDFELVAATSGSYALLLGSDAPVAFDATPGRGDYFVFDSRRQTRLITLTATVPYDPLDPLFELVNMYVLGCEDDAGFLENKPSAEHHRYRATMNPHGQLVALIGPDVGDMDNAPPAPTMPPDTKSHLSNPGDREPVLQEGEGSKVQDQTERLNAPGSSHCYYRIAVVSNRLHSDRISIRGFDWSPAVSLVKGEPLEGLVDSSHAFSYRFNFRFKQLRLSMEVCSGTADFKLFNNKNKETPLLNISGGFQGQTAKVPKRGGVIEVSTHSEQASSYILIAEDSQDKVMQLVVADPQLLVEQRQRDVVIGWTAAELQGRLPSGETMNGLSSNSDEFPLEHELFAFPVATQEMKPAANLSSPCGLYFGVRQGSGQRQVVKAASGQLEGRLQLRESGDYIVNVVARSVRTGHHVAYAAQQFHYEVPGLTRSSSPSRNSSSEAWYLSWMSFYFHDMAPIGLILLAVTILVYLRPCGRRGSSDWSHVHDFELPSWNRSGPSGYLEMSDSWGSGARGVGRYESPPLSGQVGIGRSG